VANTQIAFLDRANVPTRDALQASIHRLGFNLDLHPELTPLEDSGFWPCVLDGTLDVGFEVFYAPTSEVAAGDSNLAAIAAGRDFSISMVWRGSMRDCASAMIVSCALAKEFDAVVVYEDCPPDPYETLLENTKLMVADATKEKLRSQARPATASERPSQKPWWRFW
jgi:hypothetical protein